MSADYLTRNALGFEGDIIAKDKFKSIVEEHNLHTIIETGTYRGATTMHFSNWVVKVFTVENNEENYNYSKLILGSLENVQIYLGSSEKVLSNILSNMDKKSPKKNKFLCFLDAHWGAYNPLLDELKAIAESGLKPIIAIHDFKVPEHPELGFDVYGKIVYEWDWIKNSIEAIYGIDKFKVEYNSEAEGAKRGIIYIYPKS